MMPPRRRGDGIGRAPLRRRRGPARIDSARRLRPAPEVLRLRRRRGPARIDSARRLRPAPEVLRLRRRRGPARIDRGRLCALVPASAQTFVGTRAEVRALPAGGWGGVAEMRHSGGARARRAAPPAAPCRPLAAHAWTGGPAAAIAPLRSDWHDAQAPPQMVIIAACHFPRALHKGDTSADLAQGAASPASLGQVRVAHGRVPCAHEVEQLWQAGGVWLGGRPHSPAVSGGGGQRHGQPAAHALAEQHCGSRL